MWAPSVILKHRRYLHCSRGRPCYRDAFHYKGATRKFYNQWRQDWFLQFHNPETWGFLRRGATGMGLALKVYSQLAFIHEDCQGPRWSGSFCTTGRRSEVCCQPIQTTAQQEAAAHIPLLFVSLEDMGSVLYTGCLAAIQETKDGKGS